ncbi:MAG: GrpB family protein [Gemmatimonadetes bacterium]|nr:GrpB family protein [Gemmatimonadota bacterium]
MITVTSYNEDWPKRFREIRDCLRTELAQEVEAFEVEHIGSTAVPGLVSRPVLDICVIVPETSDMASLISGLERLGYIHEAGKGPPGLETFRRKGPDVPFLQHKRDFAPHHLYASVLGDPELQRYLAFRDHLQEDADARAAYAKIKIDLAPHADADEYLRAKTVFITSTLAGIGV